MELSTGIGLLLAILALVAPVTPGFQNPWMVATIWFSFVVYAIALVVFNWPKVASTVALYPIAATLVCGVYAFFAIAGLFQSYVLPQAKASAAAAVQQPFVGRLDSVRHRRVGNILVLVVLVSVENNSGRPSLLTRWRLNLPGLGSEVIPVFEPNASLVLSDRTIPPEDMLAVRSQNAVLDGALLRGWMTFEVDNVTEGQFTAVADQMTIRYTVRSEQYEIRWNPDLSKDLDDIVYPMPK